MAIDRVEQFLVTEKICRQKNFVMLDVEKETKQLALLTLSGD
jgi:hypothetical protein